ncbi:hypothetical protein I316_03376 [Kwoniella heveanensis BCC8398]|uniref:Csf1 N-terminal domain-containing protein n=1 Tax=Kwoniella heveanensis BCC8398 TaxID=1296120 RepID=A0A1B9GUW6_9TREE|nr:hypothetical protein I316_03376 [Kwoniella heveanensis BCC8398]
MAVSDEVNLLLLIELAAVVIAASAFLFYWNRLLGWLIAFLVRLYAWRRQNAYIVIGSLQISPLAGRISFRDVEYHSSNISVRALHGHVTWRYWKVRIRQEADSESVNSKRNRLPCRITVFAEGVEAFVYNRTPAYDAIVERMKKHENEQEEDQNGEPTKQSSRSSGETTTADPQPTLTSRLRKVTKTSTRGSTAKPSENGHTSHDYPPEVNHAIPSQVKPVAKVPPDGVNWFREALPIDIRVMTGSVVLGSDATPMVLIGDFKQAEGTLEVTDSRSSLDLYKTAVNLTFHGANVLMRTNVDYSGPLLAHGKKVYDELLQRQPSLSQRPPSTLSIFAGFRLLAKQFAFLYDPKYSSPPVAGLPTDKVWKGLARYRELDASNTKGPKREEREYAKVTRLLETHKLELSYYADTPGLVPHPDESPYVDDQDEIGNVDLPPEYGIDIVIHKGNVRYGPWADQQREAIQRAFAPSLFFDSEPKPRLQLGDTRVHTTLVLHLLLEDETVMRIPTREPSKDWQYDNAPADVERRYGWLDVVVGPNSSISYTQDQVATKHGYDSMLVLQLDSLGISSSVNLDTFIKAKTCKLSMTMPTPLEWDAQRDWGMDVTLDTPSISLLRDHVTLISDLAKDWSSGATVGDYHHFVPNHYNFRISLIHYAFHLYINDYNIIDAPWSRDTNAFLDVYGPRLDSFVAVASTQYRPEFSTVPFSVHLSDARVELCVPKWDTHRAFGDDTIEIGKIGDITAKGSYLYYSVPRPDHQETLNLHLEGKQVIFKALGWVLRRLFCVKDNYFGGFTQFKTMQEYLEKFDHDPESVGDPIEEKYRPGRSDPFAVIVTMNVEESLILMSDEIFNCKQGVVMPVPQLQMSLKSVEHFMELSLDAPPTYIVPTSRLDEAYSRGYAPSFSGKDAVFIEGIELKANRLFGPAPHATTYLCLWEATVPKISAFLSPDMVSTLKAVGRAVAYTFPDPDNGPAEIYVPRTPPDVTFFKLSLEEIVVMLTTGGNGISVEAPAGIYLDTSTYGTRSYSSMMGVVLPSLCINVLERDSKKMWRPIASLQAGATIDVYKAPTGWRDKVALQQEFLRKEDGPTGRIWSMLQDVKPPKENHADGLFLPRPMQDRKDDAPVDDDDMTITSAQESTRLSSEPSSDADSPSRPVALSQRSRSFATAIDAADTSSVGDESDSDSSESSAAESGVSSSTTSFADMATGLDARLKKFRLFQHRHDHVRGSTNHSTSMITGQQVHPNRTVAAGTVTRIFIQAIDIGLTPASVPALSNVLVGLSKKDDGHEKRLDALLVAQVDSAVEEGSQNPDPQILDLFIPTIQARVLSADVDPSSINGEIQGVRCDLYQRGALPGSPSILDLKSSISSINVIGSVSSSGNGRISLRDVAGLDVSESHGIPIVRWLSNSLDVGVHQGQGARVQVRVSSSTLDTVTPVVAFTTAFIAPWEAAVSRIRANKPYAISDAQMLYAILKTAIESGHTAYLPAFAYERAYGLHVQDHRNIRTQTGWWLIARFRDWHRRMPINISAPESSLETMADYVISQLCKFEDMVNGAESVVRQQRFIKDAFGRYASDATSTPQETKGKAMDLFVYADHLQVNHHGRLLKSLAMATSSLTLDKASVGVSKATGVRDDQPVTQVEIVTAIETTRSRVHDSLLSLIQPVLNRQSPRTSTPVNTRDRQDKTVVVIANVQVQSVDIDVFGAGLRLHYQVDRLLVTQLSRKSFQYSSQPSLEPSRNIVNATCSSMQLTLLEASTDQSTEDRSTDRIIVSLKTEALRTVLERNDSSRAEIAVETRVVLGLRSVDFESKPQLRAFYAFVQVWKERELPFYVSLVEDIKAATKTSENGGIDEGEPSTSETSAPAERLMLDISVEETQLQVRAAKALWLRWTLGKVYASRQGPKDNVHFAIRAAPQVVGAYTSLRKSKAADSSALRLPTINILGHHKVADGRPNLDANLEMGFFTGILKPVILDRLLSVHQRVAADLTQFIRDWRGDVSRALSKRHAKGLSMVSVDSMNSTMAAEKRPGLLFNVHISVTGIRFGLRADDVATTLLFEALVLEGRATNHKSVNDALHWQAKVDHFGLSLGHLGRQALSDKAEPTRRHRTAYMSLDAEVQEHPASNHTPSKLNINLSRVHTIMHPQALSELADLMKSWIADLHVLRDHRAEEVAEVKENTTKVLKRLESAERVEHSEVSWFANRLVTVEVLGVGVAIPLVDGTAIGSGDHTEVPAMLYSIRVMSFQNRRNETARLKVQNMALQFVSSFDQSSTEQFTGDFHESVNCMTLPSIDSEAQMSSTAQTWQLSAHCSATDFKLSLSPEIVDSVYKLIDLFEHGRDRIFKLEAQYRSEMAKQAGQESVSAKYEDPTTPVSVRTSQRVLVKMSYTFNSGIVELHREMSESERRSMNKDARKNRYWHDTVVLPTVSLWMDYAGPKLSSMPSGDPDDEAALLLFNAAVHESRNSLRPTILPFFVQVINRMEDRARHRDRMTTMAMSTPQTSSETPQQTPSIEQTAPASTSLKAPSDKIRLRVTLRIDKSRLRFSCAPDSNAYADLKWESGGFLASTTIGDDEAATVAGTVSGVTAYLRHEFAEEGQSCIEAGTKNLAFSIAYCPHCETRQRGLSVVLDTQLSAQFRLEQFSAWLTFAAVWIESAPPLDLPPKSALVEAATTPSNQVPILPRQQLAIAALIRFRSVEFNANVGVTSAKLEVTPIVLHTLSNGEKTEVDLKIGVSKITAKGDISGEIRSEQLTFRTMRQSSRSASNIVPTVLSMTIDAGDLTGRLFLQEMAVLRFHLEPAVVRLVDDWRAFHKDHDSQVNLAFSVKTGMLRAVTRLLAIPSLLNKLYSISNAIDSQERMASQRSSTFKATKLRKSTEPSPMVAVIIQATRKTGRAMTSAHIRTSQTMRFDLAGVDVGIFNAPITEDRDGHFYRFTIGKVETDLARLLTKEGLPRRDLDLIVHSVEWETSDGRKAARAVATMNTSLKAIIAAASAPDRRHIAWLPSVTMTMSSIEEPRPPVLVYDFDLVWGQGDGDIAIYPVFFEEAYRTLTDFVKGLNQEQITKAKRRGEDDFVREKKAEQEAKQGSMENEPLTYRKRVERQAPLPFPRLRLLGEGTRGAMEAVPRINRFSEQLPIMIHKAATSSLEDGMDL